MSTVTLEEAQALLADLIDLLGPGEEVVILRADRPIARLVASGPRARMRREPGFMKGTVLHMAPDFDAPLDDFREYME
jgi:antitoxin (DNA-binding transcriptional repressor) of toxin-antitoxin stability system